MKKLLMAALCGLMCLSGCGTSKQELKEEVKQDAKASAEEAKKKEEEKKAVVDEAFIESLKEGLIKRWKLAESDEYGNVLNSKWVAYPEAELAEIEGFADQEFNDPELKEKAVRYIENLKELASDYKELETNYAQGCFDLNGSTFERAELLRDFYENYGFSFTGKDKEDFDKILKLTEDKESNAEQGLYNHLRVEAVDDGYGSQYYKFYGENDTDNTYGGLYYVMQVEDRNGNILGNVTTESIQTIGPGQGFTVKAYYDQSDNFPSVNDICFVPQFYYITKN